MVALWKHRTWIRYVRSDVAEFNCGRWSGDVSPISITKNGEGSGYWFLSPVNVQHRQHGVFDISWSCYRLSCVIQSKIF